MGYGTIHLKIEELLREKNISKNQICKDLDIPRSNFNRYCRNDCQRMDIGILSKLMSYLDVDISELLVYVPEGETLPPDKGIDSNNQYQKWGYNLIPLKDTVKDYYAKVSSSYENARWADKDSLANSLNIVQMCLKSASDDLENASQHLIQCID